MTTYFSSQVGEICKSRQSCISITTRETKTTPNYVEILLSFTRIVGGCTQAQLDKNTLLLSLVHYV